LLKKLSLWRSTFVADADTDLDGRKVSLSNPDGIYGAGTPNLRRIRWHELAEHHQQSAVKRLHPRSVVVEAWRFLRPQ